MVSRANPTSRQWYLDDRLLWRIWLRNEIVAIPGEIPSDRAQLTNRRKTEKGEPTRQESTRLVRFN
jgi:hypothetical protein